MNKQRHNSCISAAARRSCCWQNHCAGVGPDPETLAAGHAAAVWPPFVETGQSAVNYSGPLLLLLQQLVAQALVVFERGLWASCPFCWGPSFQQLVDDVLGLGAACDHQ